MRRLGHVPALDGLRGVAILLVIGVHTKVVPGGGLGVDLFFVLSGFLITSLLVNEFQANGTIGLRAFYRRRALRLLPALGVVVVCMFTVGLVVGYAGTTASSLYAVSYTANVAVTWFDADIAQPWRHFWSLAMEEQFYLLWPLVLVFLLRRRVSPRLLVLGLCVAALACAAAAALLLGHTWPAPETHASSILLGCLAGVAFTYELVRRVPREVVIGLTGLLAIPLLTIAGGYARSHGLDVPLFSAAVAVVVVGVVLHRDWWLTRILEARILRYFGRISYGLYLWHAPLVFVLGWPLGVPLAIVIAALSYRYVEQPFLRRKRPALEEASRPGPLAVAA